MNGDGNCEPMKTLCLTISSWTILWNTTSFATPAPTTLVRMSVLKIAIKGDSHCTCLEYKDDADFSRWSHLKSPDLKEISC